MEAELIRKILGGLDSVSFRKFFIELTKACYGAEKIEIFPDTELFAYQYINARVFYRHFFIFDFLPYQIFNSLKNINLRTPNVVDQIERFSEIACSDGMFAPGNIYLINNLSRLNSAEYEQFIYPQLEKMFNSITPVYQEYGIGSVDTIVSNAIQDSERAINNLILESKNFIIRFSAENGFEVDSFVHQNAYPGVTKSKIGISGIAVLKGYRDILKEFTEILNNGTERQIQSFLADNYKFLFGDKYIDIRTEVLLRDISSPYQQKKRRIDMLLKNATTSDWDIFELKKPRQLITSYRNIPVFISDFYKSIEQVRNYASILKSDHMKIDMRNQGLEYFNPDLYLIVGQQPTNLSLGQWRSLLKDNSQNINILTYDMLIIEAQNRIDNLSKAFNQS